MSPSEAANVLETARRVQALHVEIGSLRSKIGRLSDALGAGNVAWTLQVRGVKGDAITITGDAAQLMLEHALAALRDELARHDRTLAELPLPTPPQPGGAGGWANSVP